MSDDVPRGADYDRRFERLAAQGQDMHGEATLVDSYGRGSVLDAGCGTGRVAIELSRRGHAVVGVDQDPAMLAVARQKVPRLTWVEGDLADPALSLGGPFDVVLLAGNVLIFVAPGTEGAVLSNLAGHLAEDGLLIAGYSLQAGGFTLARHDELAAAAGLALVDRWSTWDRQPFTPPGTYAVSVHRRLSAASS
ncbi:MAG TPA: class I SAM-dependent methyltransferase [Acidimicrobiales bacterium]|jgi:SAM-dependent methyltransferase|nr:class I SAM-dependent methyltransferase [Acidimicrobiales bacterium]